ncbi:hypothetical protein BGZ63DRAFT_403006 [Mariannaea sp. PMI_226]|nr:hypothetical protein BGZ63DRAFT_403006 [Mariannaea sp. PMI_226]
MAPPSGKGWMQEHRDVLGERKLSEICLPASHDAGTYRLEHGTVGGSKGTVLTQTKSISEQLELGVRRLDIRPTLTIVPGEHSEAKRRMEAFWHCGHYTGEGKDMVGWQGGSCAPITEVVDHINRFTENNAELIIVDISHVYALEMNPSITVSATERQLLPEDWDNLFRILGRLNCLVTTERCGGDTGKPLQDYKLNDYIGNGKAGVVVIVDTDNYRDQVIKHGFWPIRTLSGQPYLSLNETSVTRMQTATEAVVSLFDFTGATSVLGLTEKEHKKEFPWFLQNVAANGLQASVVWMDKIENSDLLTFCLAISYYRCYRDQGKQNPIVIVYGGNIVTRPDAQGRVQEAFNVGRSLVANNDLLGDTWPGMVKSCAVLYEHRGLIKGRWAREGSLLHFENDILSVNYGGAEVLSPWLYLRLLRTSAEGGSMLVNNQNVVGNDESDPQKGVRKTCTVIYRGLDDSQIRQQRVLEFENIEF